MPKKLYSYIYKSNARNYKLIINANSDAEAIFLRDRLLAFYANDAARLPEMLQQKGVECDPHSIIRIKEAEIYRENQHSLQLVKEWVLERIQKESTYHFYEMNEQDQQLVVYVEGGRDKDIFNLQRKDFDSISNYTEQVTQQINRIINEINESLKLIPRIEAYVAAFYQEAKESRDPIQLKAISQRLLPIHFGENFNVGDSAIRYLEKIHQEKFHSIEKYVNSGLISCPHDPLKVPDNTWGMTLLMFTVTRLSEGLLRVDVRTNQAISRFAQLLAQGHDINAQDAYGRTALMYVVIGYKYFQDGASLPGREKFTHFLLENGADPSLKDHLGKTALDYFIAQVGENHPATRLIRQKLAARSMVAPAVSSSVAEPSTSIDSIAAGGNRVFFPSSSALSRAQNTALPQHPQIEAKRAQFSNPQWGGTR